jgi:hypothetical protein
MEEPLRPPTLDPSIPPLEDAVPSPSTVPMLLVPSADPALTPPAMAHFALVEIVQLVGVALARPCGCFSPVSYTRKVSIGGVRLCHPCTGSSSCFAPALFRWCLDPLFI